MGVGTWILALVQPLLARIILSLGFSVVTMVGMDSVMSGLKAGLVSSLGAMPADGLNLFLLAGGGQAAGIITGAIATRVLIFTIQNGTKLLGVNPG
jgi:hypothetical protein